MRLVVQSISQEETLLQEDILLLALAVADMAVAEDSLILAAEMSLRQAMVGLQVLEVVTVLMELLVQLEQLTYQVVS